MKTSRLIKEQKVKQVQQELINAKFFLLISHSQLNVNHFQSLKKSLKKVTVGNAPVFLKVYKNNLLQRAVVKTHWEKLTSFLVGPLFIIFSAKSYLVVIKEVFQFLKQHKLTTFKIGFFEDEFLNPTTFQQLATLPSQKELLLQLINSLKFNFNHLVLTLKVVLDNQNKSKSN